MFQAPFITIMNMETWNSLPPEYQAVFEEWSGVDASLKFAEMWDQTADQNMQELLAVSYTHLGPPDGGLRADRPAHPADCCL